MADQDLASKLFIVTGCNSGIGRVTATTLAARGAEVIMACRSRDKTEPVLAEIKAAGGNARFAALDLADLDSVRRFAAEFLAEKRPLAALVNNAGLAGARGKTKDGFELAFGTNHLGPYLLTRLLLDHLKQHAPSRVVNVASKAHYRPKTFPWESLRESTKGITAFDEYSVSKLCNVLFTKELARRLEGTGVTTYAVHPGVVATDVWREVPAPFRWLMKLGMLTSEQGAQSSIIAAADPELAQATGRYYDWNGKDTRPSKLADDEVLAALLWKRSAEWVGLPD
jgi:NAD(P)-dependent dehydrogenase (short-subunit alcohol dehydrogenase family)